MLRIGDEGAPPLGTSDQEILQFAEQTHRLFVTDNRKSMPGHVAAHLAAGGHHWGVVNLSPSLALAQIVAERGIIWGASSADEWIDKTDWLT